MKIVCAVLLVVTLFLNVNAAPDGNLVTKDEDAILILRETFEKIGSTSLDSEEPFLRAILKSIDQNCMLKKYKEDKLLSEMLTREALNTSSSSDKEIDAKLVFFNITISCSSKLDALLEFVFDFAFTFTDLMNAFRDDEPFKRYIDDLPCYNNYAVRNNWIDTNVHTKFEYNLITKTEEECDQKIQRLRRLANVVLEVKLGVLLVVIGQYDPESCLRKKIILTAEKIFFKYAILIPTNISFKQKKNARMNFVNDIKDALNQVLICITTNTENRRV